MVYDRSVYLDLAHEAERLALRCRMLAETIRKEIDDGSKTKNDGWKEANGS